PASDRRRGRTRALVARGGGCRIPRDPQPRRVHPLQLRVARRRRPRDEGRHPARGGAHLEPARARGVPAHERHLGNRDGGRRRFRVRFLPAAARRGAPHHDALATLVRAHPASDIPRTEQHTRMATTNDIKNGSVLSIDGQLWNVVEFQHVKPGKGGAFVRTKLKNVRSGKSVDRTFNAGTKIDFATVDRRDFQYLYRDGEGFVFMDTDDYD